MKVTINNLVEKWDKVKSHVNKATIDTYESGFEDLISMYDDPDVKEQLDLFIDDVNRQLKDVELDEPKKTEEPAKNEKRYIIRAYLQSGETGDDNFYEEEIEQKEGGYKTIAEAKKVADKFINSNKKNFDCQAVIVEVVGDTEKNVKTLSAKKVEKKQPKPKKEKQQKPKFKVGQYVTDGDTFYIIKSSNYYGNSVKYDADGFASALRDAEESEIKKSTKKEYDKAEKEYLDSKKTSVPVLPVEVSLLKRYIAINDKSVAQAKERAEGLLRAIQKAITEKRIRKESKYAEEIMTCQKSLISLLRAIDAKKLKGSDKIGIENYERCKEIVDGIKVDDVVKVSNNFISKVQEREGRKQVAENIMKKLSELNEDGENKEIVSAMKKAIQDYIDGKTEKVESVERQLRGVLGSLTKKKCCSGLGSVDDDLDAQDSTISADQLLSARFDTLPFTGRWRGFFGNPSRNFKCMLYGRAGSGKSTFAIQFAKYLSSDMGMKVLYIASEEKFGNTLQEKVKRFNVANDNISFADRLPLDITKYDVVFFDSVNDMGISPDELMDMTANIAMVGIFQCTKDGMFRGGNDYSHDVDIVVKVDNMTALTEKNRFQAGNMEFAVI